MAAPDYLELNTWGGQIEQGQVNQQHQEGALDHGGDGVLDFEGLMRPVNFDTLSPDFDAMSPDFDAMSPDFDAMSPDFDAMFNPSAPQ